MTLEEKVNNNGHVEEETPEDIEIAFQNLSKVSRGDNTLVTFGKTEMSLMQKMLNTDTEKYKEESIWRLMNFADEEEAMAHIAAYYEAKDLGMDTSFNISYANSLVSTNRKTVWSNLIGMLADTLQHGKWATGQNVKGKGNGTNPRSPLN